MPPDVPHHFDPLNHVPPPGDMPIFVEHGLAMTASAPYFLGFAVAYARRLVGQYPDLQGEVKISSLDDGTWGTLIKVVLQLTTGELYDTYYIRWPTGQVLCPRCLGSKVFHWSNGRRLTCPFCDGLGIVGSVLDEPPIDD